MLPLSLVRLINSHYLHMMCNIYILYILYIFICLFIYLTKYLWRFSWGMVLPALVQDSGSSANGEKWEGVSREYQCSVVVLLASPQSTRDDCSGLCHLQWICSFFVWKSRCLMPLAYTRPMFSDLLCIIHPFQCLPACSWFKFSCLSYLVFVDIPSGKLT